MKHVVSPQPARSLVAWAKDTDSTRQPQAEGRYGRGRTLYHCGVTAECVDTVCMFLQGFPIMAGRVFSHPMWLQTELGF